MTRNNPICRKCGTHLNSGNWYPSRIKKYDYICNKCILINNENTKNTSRRRELDKIRRYKNGALPMSENKHCSSFLGVHIAERLLRNVFKNVEPMPYGNPGYDFICNNGHLIDVKSSCIHTDKNGMYGRWGFVINKNVIAEYFVLLAFNNRDAIEPLYAWIVPGYVVNDRVSISISMSNIHTWDEFRMDIEKILSCCNAMKDY